MDDAVRLLADRDRPRGVGTLVGMLVLFEYSVEIDESVLRRDRKLIDELARLALGGADPDRARKLARKLLRGSLLFLPDAETFRKALEHAGPLQADCLR